MQARSALASLQKHQTGQGLPPEECHVVVTGDFNSSKAEGVGRLLTSGWLPAGYSEPHLPQVGTAGVEAVVGCATAAAALKGLV
jgi:endonuclease/exonuclease/phosphatase family metal-dependent hydrolase